MNNTTIEWTDQSWNPVTGCTKVSQGCKNCYAERFTERFHGKGSFRFVRLHPDRLGQLKKLKDPKRIFVNSMSDLYHDDVPFEFIKQVYMAMLGDNRHTYQILTKRPENAIEFFSWLEKRDWFVFDAIKSAKYIWHGVSVEDQNTADNRIPLLISFPVQVRFLSCEPLLGSIHLHALLGKTALCNQEIHWIIAGGESGVHPRPLHPSWVRSLRDQSHIMQIAFFFKQWGEYVPYERDQINPYYTNAATGEFYDGHLLNFIDENHNEGSFKGGRWMDGYEAMMYCHEAGVMECMFLSVGKKKAGHMLDGKSYQQYPIIK